MLRRFLLCASIVACGCGGADESTPPPSVATAGDEAPAPPPPDSARAVRALVAALNLGPTAEAATAIGAVESEDAAVTRASASCLGLVQAFVAGSYEAFDMDAVCFPELESLRGEHGVTESVDPAPFRALVDASRSERIAGLPPLPPGFATETDERTFEGELTDSDPTQENQTAYDEHTLELTAGWTVTIDMVSPAFDTYLYLRGADGAPIAENDDGGEGLNSRLTHRVDVPGTYTVRASAFSPRGRGAYRLTVTLAQH
ncbi:MAG: PPC domain-containing protein [Sandaracinaceae bacterium]|nr:PPC domain-containing protein [Sandaracinaceae bacterium]